MRYRLILILFIISNILNVFAGRYSADSDRGVIHVLNAIAFIVLLIIVVSIKSKPLSIFRPLIVFLLIYCLYFLIQAINPNSYFNLGMYIRFAMNLCLIYALYHFKEKKWDMKLMQLFILTFILECSIKIFSGISFENIADLTQKTGGDTASIGLALIIPLIFYYFNEKQGFILYITCFLISLCSLRRTSILAIVVATPFIWSNIKQYVNKRSLVILLSLSVATIMKTWNFIGPKLMVRIFEYSEGISAMESYGSGRTEFWEFLIEKYIEGNSTLLGYGMGSIYETFSKYWSIPLSHSHNDFLEILYTFGIVGLLLWGVFLYNVLKLCKNSVASKEKNLLFCAMAVYIVVAVTSGCIIRAEFYPMALAIGLLIKRNIQNSRAVNAKNGL